MYCLLFPAKWMVIHLQIYAAECNAFHKMPFDIRYANKIENIFKCQSSKGQLITVYY